MKRGRDVLMETRVSVVSCVCGSVKAFSRGRERRAGPWLSGDPGALDKEPFNRPFDLHAEPQPVFSPPTQHHDPQHNPSVLSYVIKCAFNRLFLLVYPNLLSLLKYATNLENTC